MPQIIPDFTPKTSDIPIIGPWMGKIGRLQQIQAIPCNPTPKIMAYAFWQQLPFLIYTLTVPDCEDIIQGAIGGFRHKHRRGLHIKDGHVVPGHPPEPGIGWRAFDLWELSDKVGFWMMIIDASLDLEINWMSTAYQYSGCGVASPSFAQWEAPAGSDVVGGGLDWHPFPMVLTQQASLIADQTTFAIPPRSNYSYATNIRCVPGPFQPATTSIGIRLTDNNGLVVGSATGDPDGNGNYNTLMYGQLAGDIDHYRSFTLEASKAPGLFYITDSQWSASALEGKWSNPVPCADFVKKWW